MADVRGAAVWLHQFDRTARGIGFLVQRRGGANIVYLRCWQFQFAGLHTPYATDTLLHMDVTWLLLGVLVGRGAAGEPDPVGSRHRRGEMSLAKPWRRPQRKFL